MKDGRGFDSRHLHSTRTAYAIVIAHGRPCGGWMEVYQTKESNGSELVEELVNAATNPTTQNQPKTPRISNQNSYHFLLK